MIIYPAIDIKDGNCVRLLKGDFSTVHKVANDPFETAYNFKKAGATHLHMVDLDGALDGKIKNSDLIINVARESGLLVDIGGGIRSLETVEYYLANGIDKVVLGSVAVKNPEVCAMAAKEFKDKIIIGIDAKDEYVAAEGWIEKSDVHFITLAKEMENMGIQNITYTDISKDGTLKGPSLDHLVKLLESVSCNIIASGGISNINDIHDLCKIGAYGAICGKSLYQGTLSLEEAIEVAYAK